MEKILKEFAETAASVLTERCQVIDADRRSRFESDRFEELTVASVELSASGEHSETSARIAIVDSPE